MATTGVRGGEALGLRWEDLDLDARTLRVNRTVYRGQSCLPRTDVSEMLDHSDVSITLSIYAHVLPDMQDGAAKAMDDALS
jgi:integrase